MSSDLDHALPAPLLAVAGVAKKGRSRAPPSGAARPIDIALHQTTSRRKPSFDRHPQY